MELTNDFVIDRNIEETWTILNDLEFIAPCMPGAQLTEIEGEEYRGLVKIKDTGYEQDIYYLRLERESLIFFDGFESGDEGAWSSSFP